MIKTARNMSVSQQNESIYTYEDISMRFLSGSRKYMEEISPSAPVRKTGPSMMSMWCDCKFRRISEMSEDVMKHKSADPAVGLFAFGSIS